MNIYELKKRYYEECTSLGVIGKWAIYLNKFIPFYMAILFTVAGTIVIGFAAQETTTMPKSIYFVLIIVSVPLVMFFLIIALFKWINKEKYEKRKIDNFNNLIMKYYLNDDTILEYTLQTLKRYSEKTKYKGLIEKAIWAAILLPIWTEWIKHLFKLFEDPNDFIYLLAALIVSLSSVIFFYIIIKLIQITVFDGIANNESQEFHHLATRLEQYQFEKLLKSKNTFKAP